MRSKRIVLHDENKLNKINPDTVSIMQKYKVDMCMRNLSAKTQKHYIYDLQQWFIYILDNQQNRSIIELSDDDIMEFLYFCKSEGKTNLKKLGGLKMSKLTLDEAIKHCLETAEQLEERANIPYKVEDSELQDNACRECAADHRQLAEWLTELKEAKRLLKLAVDDFKEINSDILTCKYCKWHSVEIDECTYYPDDVPCEQICGWKYEGEALKLIGGSENENNK